MMRWSIKQLTQLRIDGKDLQEIKDMYWEQQAAMRVDGEISSLFKQIKCIRKECVLFQDLFSLYSEIIMRNLEGYKGIKVGEHNLRYTDDTVLIAEKKEFLQLLDTAEYESTKKGL